MSKKLSIVYETDQALLAEAEKMSTVVDEKAAELYMKEMDYTGWVGYADSFPENELSDILDTADEISGKCKYFVVIGIGGSYLGARAALSFIDRQDSSDKKGRPEVLFAGFNLSSTYHAELIDKIKDEDFCILIISKSGGTLEPSVAFTCLKELLCSKYGQEEAFARIYAITDKSTGKLRKEAGENGYKTFILPSDVGGRYSVLTPVGLLPLAVAGIDIRTILDGAKFANTEEMISSAKKLACMRAVLEKQKCVQTCCFFDPSVEDFTAWLLQLFGESEGKERRGVLPVGIGISRDLHSLGQFLQDGKQIFYEMLLFISEPTRDIEMSGASAGEYAGRSYSEFNTAVMEGMIKAHRDVDIPIVRVYIPDNSAYSFGQAVYFFEMTCALTGLLMGINPFDQPGVEAYKKGMLEYLDM